MNDSNQVPKWFFVAAILAIFWQIMGVMAYLQTVMLTGEDVFKLPRAEQIIIINTPSWAIAAFAIAVFSGLIGSVLLLLKQSISFHFFVLSLCAVIVQMYHAFFIMDSIAVFGPGGMIMPIMIIVIAILLIWLAHFAKSKFWIK